MIVRNIKHFSFFILFFSLYNLIYSEDYAGEISDRFYGGSYHSQQKVGSYGSMTKTKTYSSSQKQYPGQFYPTTADKKVCAVEKLSAVNSMIQCDSLTSCEATCMDGYQFPNGDIRLYAKCVQGEWEIDKSEWPSLPPCQPVCLPRCQNNGICIAPGECSCPENFEGPQCQYKKEPCLSFPPAPINGKRNCTSKICHVMCSPGHKFEDGSSMVTLKCQNGMWISSKTNNLMAAPKCIPQCNPPCANGGVCLSLNICQCPQNFRGPQCQYSVDACDVNKLGFNGGYQCAGSATELSCTLSCPGTFSSPPAKAYVCSYETGQFSPQPIPQCLTSSNQNIIYFPGQNHYEIKTKYQETSSHRKSASIPNLPRPGVCISWGGAHFKTFDGTVFSFASDCRHVLVSDSLDKLFKIAYKKTKDDIEIIIYLRDKEYTLQGTGQGDVTFKSSKHLLPIPAQLSGLKVDMAGHMVRATIEGVGVVLKWDTKRLLQIDVNESLWNRTEGMCGTIDGLKSNDLIFNSKDGSLDLASFARRWQMKKLDEQCVEKVSVKNVCELENPEINLKAENHCKKLISHTQFSKCSKIMDINLLMNACKWDYCECLSDGTPESCACDSLSVYATHCISNGIKSLVTWRDQNICALNCSGGRVYKSCGPATQPSCGSAAVVLNNNDPQISETCTEGCFCPIGTYIHEGKCVSKEQCPCRLRGKVFPPRASISKDCNTCVCENGEWVCTQMLCGSRCSAQGDPHYQTFDGKHYNFMGQCSYYLLKGANYAIEAENVPCNGAIDFPCEPNPADGPFRPSCTKSLTIKYDNTIVKLQQDKVVEINGKIIDKLPVRANGIKIREASSLFITAELFNGLIIWWNGITSVYIDAPAIFRGKTMGLCGTFNGNQNDDFVTPENDVEQSVEPFANKWKANELCPDVKKADNPCEVNVQNTAMAEEICSVLKDSLFEECHWSVDVKSFYEDCLYDVCACEGSIEKCLCPMIVSYATECANQGINIDWRSQIKECAINCPIGQTYQVCGDSCFRSCADLSEQYQDELNSTNPHSCEPKCVEGCNCPSDQSLDSKGNCIPTGSCPCYYNGMEFPSHYKEVRSNHNQQELCECVAARWNCKLATKEDILKYPKAASIKDKCNATRYEEFTTCEPRNPKTCKNLHEPEKHSESSSIDCQPGCKCMQGFVFDIISKRCIRPEECPCQHGGRSYADGQTMQEECNKCKCNAGKWDCEKRVCDGVCSAWGDSHYHTFDGKSYDFQGVCSYLLAKGQLDFKENSFSVEIQNEICGTAGVTCSKAVVLKVGEGENVETITFNKDKIVDLNKAYKRIKLRAAGLFIYAEIASLGMVLQWDKGTRVYIRVSPTWKGKLKGLCGNYNDNQADDFQTPSGGISESSALLFGDSWKLQAHCPPAYEMQDTCALYPERQMWASQKCGIIKRAPFSDCHSEVPPEKFVQRCERDTCACGKGGDCECLCTALAAYAYACASRGIPIKWRTQQLCPMQCDEGCTNYSPCISSCPVETCENTMNYQQISRLCLHDNCIEGCEHKKPCKIGEIFTNDTFEECIPRSACKPLCMTLADGTKILEGDVLNHDDCHICTCSRGKKICQGEPCAPVTQPPEKLKKESITKCKQGWTVWMNKSLNNKTCKAEEITKIQCRTAGTKLSIQEAKIDAKCDLEKGFVCRQPKEKPCPDFEIKLFCNCDDLSHYVCDPARPNIEHPEDCAMFYQCAEGIGPPEHPNLIKKTCGNNMLYNPVTMICDWSESVFAIKPECGDALKTGEIEFSLTTPMYEITTLAPEFCAVENLVPILWNGERLKKDAFTASSFKEPLSSPHNCQLKNGSSWIPKDSNDKQFLQVALGNKSQTIYGIVFQGNPSAKQFVTGYKVSYSNDGSQFNYVIDKKTEKKKIFTGPQDNKTPSKQLFDSPFFAKFVKIEPVSWQGSIAVRLELLGCNKTQYEQPIIQTTTPSFLAAFNQIGHSKCAEGQQWLDCLIDCNKICINYLYELQQKGICSNNEQCIPGCEDSVNIGKCKGSLFLRGPQSCVEVNNCPCISTDGLMTVKPGKIVREESGAICQCIDNKYVCDSSMCESTTAPTPTTTVPPIDIQIITQKKNDTPAINEIFSFLSPPPNCPPESLKPILFNKVSKNDATLVASSFLTPAFAPVNARLNEGLNENSGGCWTPKSSTANEYIGVQFKRKEPIYGIIMQGSSLFEHYVSSYTVMYGDDEKSATYSAKGFGSTPEVFRGPIDNIHAVEQLFDPPIETKFIKIIPLTWYDTIAVRMELLGCSKILPSSGSQIKEPKCQEPLVNLPLPIENLLASSQKPDHMKENCDIDGEDAWEPLTYSPVEWIQFEFVEVFIVTNIATKGGSKGWVKSFKVRYSSDNIHWNKVLDKDGVTKVFLANFDKETLVDNELDIPLRAKYLRIIPMTWQDKLQLRIQPIGCVDIETRPLSEKVACDKPSIMVRLPIENLEASSFIPYHNVEFININKSNAWQPLATDKENWVQFNYDKPHKIVGLETKGGPDGWVSSFYIKYSPDGSNWVILRDEQNKMDHFVGNTDSLSVKNYVFNNPISMKNLRIKIKDWEIKPQLQVQLLSCETPKIRKKLQAFKCEEPHELLPLPSENFISSSYLPEHSAECVDFNDTNVWQPLPTDKEKWIQFNYLEPHEIVGLVTKGGSEGWTSKFSIKYSPEGHTWHSIKDQYNVTKKFTGNVDNNSLKLNMFDKALPVQSLRIVIDEWQKAPQIKAQPMICSEVNEEVERIIIPEVFVQSIISNIPCEICPGIHFPEDGCKCSSPMLYNGQDCVARAECPCVFGHISYPIGAIYENDNCERCVCILGGFPECKRKACPPCQNNTISTTSSNCDCMCTKCPEGKKACPTNNVCILESLWCDGFQDCPDDEKNCKPPPSKITEAPEEKCPTPSCPDGYKIVMKPKIHKLPDNTVSNSIFKDSTKSYMRYYKGATKSSSYSGIKSGTKSFGQQQQLHIQRNTLETPEANDIKECANWQCVSNKTIPAYIPKKTKAITFCETPQCPPGYIVSTETENTNELECPKYICSPPPHKDVVCNVTCNIFNTFDDITYQYDICNHVLARDTFSNEWDITIQKNCSKSVCVNELLITQEHEQVRLKPDLTIEYNNNPYTVDQTKKIGLKSNTFVVSRLGNTLFFISTQHKFWVIYDTKGDVKIGISGKLFGKVDGLCGYFNDNPNDDRRKPDGSLALSTEEFGDSWTHKNNEIVCHTNDCPINLQQKALKLCNSLKDEIFKSCRKALNVDQYHAQCLERMCECLQSDEDNQTTEKDKEQNCKCNSLQNFVTDCLATDPTASVLGWKTVMTCNAYCPQPLVHYDCYRRRCEPCCETYAQDSESCPIAPGVCFSGCFCPEGLIRKGDACVLPSECRDCVCDSFGKAEYLTFDRKNFTLNGNCTYVVARDTKNNAFQVFVTNDNCPNDRHSVCTSILHIIYEDHIIHIKIHKDGYDAVIDGVKALHYPVKKDWMTLYCISENSINLLIPKIQLEISLLLNNLAFTIRVPSALYGSKLEGLCGDCDGDDRNDFKPSNNSRSHTLQWKSKPESLKLLGVSEGTCVEKIKKECKPLPPERDPCLKMLNPAIFGNCHPLVDPTSYVTSCQQNLCNNKTNEICVSFETYAGECRRAGICLDWREKCLCPFECKNGQIYKSCGLGCQVTCENYEKYKTKSKICTAAKIEGCFCPEGEVPVNGTCIPFAKCFPCDSEGHFVGDEWEVDECTTCSCPKRGAGVICSQKTCSIGTTCETNFVPVQVAKVPGQCCPEFVCGPEIKDQIIECEDPVKIQCSYGQVMKLDTLLNGCKRFICECIPPSECDPLNKTENLKPGMEEVIDSSGCCPKSKLVCNLNKCPEPPKCDKHYELKKMKNEGQCCATYSCELPSDKCLYKMEYESSPVGGELKRKPNDVETTVKAIGSSWQDGPCRYCTCKKTTDNTVSQHSSQTPPRALCTVTPCQPVESTEDYLIEPVGIPFACCKEAKYSACKHQGAVFKIGEEIKSATNSCISYICVDKHDGTLEKRTNIKSCDKKCKPGFSYTPSNSSKICCGECVPKACIVDGKEHKIGEEWTSKDFCTNFKCLNKNGTLQIQSLNVACPTVSKTMKDDFELEETSVEGKCCKKVKPIACKVDGKVYKINEEWKSPTNSCISYSCKVKDENQLEKYTNVKQCNRNCKLGYKYVESTNPQVCCGECVAKVCVVNGTEHKIDEKWTSDDFCTIFKCSNKNGNLVVEKETTSCPSHMKLKDEFLTEEIKQPSTCCKKLKFIACKDNGTVHKIGEQWQSDKDPCISHVCIQKADHTLEKQTNMKQCQTKCKQGYKYTPPKNPASTCCGDCIASACVVDNIEYPIGKEWTSKDFCITYVCKSHTNGTLQVQASKVTCPQISDNMKENFIFEDKAVEGKCCKQFKAVACKHNGQIFGEGATWVSETDCCMNFTCTLDSNGKLSKQETLQTCQENCAPGWEYKPSNNPDICCGNCIQTSCITDDVKHKEGAEWYSTDGCVKYVCEKQNNNLMVTSYNTPCPDISNCDPADVYTKGCCQYCNSSSACLIHNLPLENTIGLIKIMKHPHGLCHNKQPVKGFNECKGTCKSGTIFNKEKGKHENTCSCCVSTKYDNITVAMTCTDGFVFKEQVSVPVSCSCKGNLENASDIFLPTKQVKSHTKARPRAIEKHELDDVEIL